MGQVGEKNLRYPDQIFVERHCPALNDSITTFIIPTEN